VLTALEELRLTNELLAQINEKLDIIIGIDTPKIEQPETASQIGLMSSFRNKVTRRV
jgi:hypothetical protein